MTADLVQRLRTCSTDERRTVAMELGQIGTDEAIAELIRMVEGRRRHGLRWYDLDDQLLGVDALAETSKTEALDYLKRVYNTTKSAGGYSRDILVYDGGSSAHEDVHGSFSVNFYRHPLARRKLAKKLAYEKHTVDTLESVEDGESPDISIERDDNIHQRFQMAIAKLEKSAYQRPA